MIPPPPHSLAALFTVSCALGAALAFGINLMFFLRPRGAALPGLPALSVLIPARNEELSIGAAVESVLASTGLELEVLVLDDASTDRTAELVAALAARDSRVRLVSSSALPHGWNGKQFACHSLACLARYPWLCFLDADVRLAPEALGAVLAHAQRRRMDLVSGFPEQETGTWLEKLLIPLIHVVLLCYLPMPGMRLFPLAPALAAGCGQLMLVRAAAYTASGGHQAICSTMHDGLLLPKLLRRHRFPTDLLDLTGLARCRMYRNAAEVWRGLGKNATEGMAAPWRILPFTLLLLFGQVLPVLWLAGAAFAGQFLFWPAVATAAGYLVRLAAMRRFHQNALGALLNPLAVAMLLTLQWWALARKLLGRQAVWKQRAYDVG